MQTSNPTPQEALQALERHVSIMVSEFRSDDDYYWGGSNCSELDHAKAFALFHFATGLDIEDSESENPTISEFYSWGLNATEEEIVCRILELAKKNLKGN